MWCTQGQRHFRQADLVWLSVLIDLLRLVEQTCKALLLALLCHHWQGAVEYTPCMLLNCLLIRSSALLASKVQRQSCCAYQVFLSQVHMQL